MINTLYHPNRLGGAERVVQCLAESLVRLGRAMVGNDFAEFQPATRGVLQGDGSSLGAQDCADIFQDRL